MLTTDNTLWVEKYRPTVLDDYIGDSYLKDRIQRIIETGDVPHLLFYGSAGTGKTTIAKLIARSVDADVLVLNASDDNGVDVIRNKIERYASTYPIKSFKIVILDEADYLTDEAQAALRNLMETFSKKTRFILTCNYIQKIKEPIVSRCQPFEISPPTRKECAIRLIDILNNENVNFELEAIGDIVNSSYPDMRQIINITQQNVVNNELKIKDNTNQYTYLREIIEILSSPVNLTNDLKSIRYKLANSGTKSYERLYRLLYDELENIFPDVIADAIITISEYQYQDANVVDKEINVCALLAKLLQLKLS